MTGGAGDGGGQGREKRCRFASRSSATSTATRLLCRVSAVAQKARFHSDVRRDPWLNYLAALTPGQVEKSAATFKTPTVRPHAEFPPIVPVRVYLVTLWQLQQRLIKQSHL